MLLSLVGPDAASHWLAVAGGVGLGVGGCWWVLVWVLTKAFTNTGLRPPVPKASGVLVLVVLVKTLKS